jgi:diguanylate cyclase (GGDEF)-like protein
MRPSWRALESLLPRRLAHRLFFVVGAPLVLAILAGLAVYGTLRSAVATQEETERIDRVVEAASALGHDRVKAETGIHLLSLTGEEAFLAPFDALVRLRPSAVRELEVLLAADPLQLERLRRIDGLFESWRREVVTATTRATGLPAARRAEALAPVTGIAGQRLTEQMGMIEAELIGAERWRLARADARLSARDRAATATALAGLAGAVLLGLLVVFGFTRRVLGPIRALARAAVALQNGILSERAEVCADDELGGLARSFNAMADRIDRRDRDLARRHELSHLLQTASDAPEAITIFERFTPALLPGASGALYTISASRIELDLRSRFGANEDAARPQTAPEDCWALRQGHAYLVPDVDRKLVCEHLGGRHGLRDPYVCLPLLAQGETLGLLHVSFPGSVLAGAPLEARLEELEAIGTILGLALSNLALREKLKAQSVRDALTGFYNRRFLEESLPREIERCRRRGLPLAVVMADLDHFKKLNDTWGHEAGDLALQRFADAARRHFRKEDLLCRYGGEEFCFVLPECSLEDARVRASEQLEAQRSAIVRFGRDSVGPVTTSLGLAGFPSHADEGAALLRLADGALYRAKLLGRDRLVVHDEIVAA